MFTCDWVFFGFIEEIAVNRFRLVVDLPNQTGSPTAISVTEAKTVALGGQLALERHLVH
jgi:hypothetical protein